MADNIKTLLIKGIAGGICTLAANVCYKSLDNLENPEYAKTIACGILFVCSTVTGIRAFNEIKQPLAKLLPVAAKSVKLMGKTFYPTEGLD